MVMFASGANNLVAGDTNDLFDVFVRKFDLVLPLMYCPPKLNSQRCTPSVDTSGTASASSTQPFWINARQVLNNKTGVLLYSTTSSHLLPFESGWLCLGPPIRSTTGLSAGGTPPPATDCTGEYHFDFNAWIQSGVDPLLVAGQEVWAQFYSRDPAFPSRSTGLSNAVAFAIGP
jgi:hypothetical protein